MGIITMVFTHPTNFLHHFPLQRLGPDKHKPNPLPNTPYSFFPMIFFHLSFNKYFYFQKNITSQRYNNKKVIPSFHIKFTFQQNRICQHIYILFSRSLFVEIKFSFFKFEYFIFIKKIIKLKKTLQECFNILQISKSESNS